jgi:hypothetical protein
MQYGIFDLTSAWFLRISWKKVFWSGLLSNFFIKSFYRIDKHHS